MAKNKTTAKFKSAAVAAVFGVTEKDTGIVTFNANGVVTVQFKNGFAEQVSAKLFDITEKAEEVAAPVEVSDEGSN